MIDIALIGTGYWGPNIAKSFELTGRARIHFLCDKNPDNLDRVAKRYPTALVATDIDEVLKDEKVSAIAISTPADSHFILTKKALLAGKHVLVEKPITLNSDQAFELAKISKDVKKILMVGHTFIYNSTVRELKKIVDSSEIGEILYIYFERANLGPVRTDVNALWDLAAHDVSIMCELTQSFPESVVATGQSFLNSNIEDTVFVTYKFSNKVMAHIHASWLSPKKVRKIVIVGSKKMVIWDDLDLFYPIKIFDKRIDWSDIGQQKEDDSFFAHKAIVFDQGITIPKVQLNQPLKEECEHFLDCIEKNKLPKTDGYNGLEIVKALEAATESLKNQSKMIFIEKPKII